MVNDLGFIVVDIFSSWDVMLYPDPFSDQFQPLAAAAAAR